MIINTIPTKIFLLPLLGRSPDGQGVGGVFRLIFKLRYYNKRHPGILTAETMEGEY